MQMSFGGGIGMLLMTWNKMNTNIDAEALRDAAKAGDMARVEEMLAVPGALVRQGVLPIHASAASGGVEAARLLLEHGAEGTWESLRVAARNGNREIAACLLDHGCFAGEREIMEAAVERHIEIVELLVAHRGSGRGVPAAEMERLIDTVGYLMEWGSAPRSRVIVEYLKPRGAAGAAALAHYRAALLRAAEKEGETEIVAEL